MQNKQAVKKSIRDLYKALPEEDQAVIAFGMMPKYLMDRIEKGFKKKAAKVQAKKWGVEDPEIIDMMSQSIKKEIVSKYMKNVHVMFMQVAKAAGKMIA